METDYLQDDVFGTIALHRNPKARRFIFRVKQGQLHITLPERAGIKSLQAVIETKRQALQKLFSRHVDNFLKYGDVVYMHDFVVVIDEAAGSSYRSRRTGDTLHLTLPLLDTCNDREVQEKIARLIRPHLKASAERYLPERLKQWSEKIGSRYSGIVISHGRHRLGSCRNDHRITLSYYLMCLPDRLIDYVILHELAHLHEMNHSARFHELCNRYCDGKEAALRKELRQFPFPIE